jgi:hypothetical protein
VGASFSLPLLSFSFTFKIFLTFLKWHHLCLLKDSLVQALKLPLYPWWGLHISTSFLGFLSTLRDPLFLWGPLSSWGSEVTPWSPTDVFSSVSFSGMLQGDLGTQIFPWQWVKPSHLWITRKTTYPIFVCNLVWPTYKLLDLKVWSLYCTLNYNVILQFELFCCNSSKKTEVPNVQASVSLSQGVDLWEGCWIHLACLLELLNS